MHVRVSAIARTSKGRTVIPGKECAREDPGRSSAVKYLPLPFSKARSLEISRETHYTRAVVAVASSFQHPLRPALRFAGWSLMRRRGEGERVAPDSYSPRRPAAKNGLLPASGGGGLNFHADEILNIFTRAGPPRRYRPARSMSIKSPGRAGGEADE